MSAILSIKNSVNNINNLFNDINGSNSAYYFFVGKPSVWPNEPIPNTAVNSFGEFEQSIYHDIIFGKLLTNTNVAFMTLNNQWANNTIYDQYDPNDANLFSKKFYVTTQNMNVYKVIDNNNRANSIIQPSITSTTGSFKTSDGYVWKYMFTVPSSQNTNFTTNTYIPVVPNTYVTNNSIQGTIDVTRIVTNGSNYQAFDSGFINNIISPSIVQIHNTASTSDNFYVGSSIYLKAGLGADQIRPIIAYNGSTKNLTVYPQFSLFTTLQLSNNIVGDFSVGNMVQQNIANIFYLYPQGFFNKTETMLQSDTGATGLVSVVNSSILTIFQSSGNNFSAITPYPIIDTNYAGIIQAGGVNLTIGSNVITGNSTATFNTSYAIGQYIYANTSARRITSITNTSYMTVSIPLNQAGTQIPHYKQPNVIEPTSVVYNIANGVIIQNNITSSLITYGNVSSNSILFILGETIKEYDINGIDQSTNAVISFVNSTAMVISSIGGSFTTSAFIVGQSSSLQAQITNIITFPSITLSNAQGTFVSGAKINTLYANGSLAGNVRLLSASYNPSITTQYIISPTVKFAGDGYGAIAYSTVNTNPASGYPVTSATMINTGTGYTNAYANISSNSQWGSGASVSTVLSPINGHGANAYVELGARFAGISVNIDTLQNESYKFPSYGTYRRVGIIKNPLFDDLTVNLSPVLRANASIQLLGANSFIAGEMIYQYSTLATALVIGGNTTSIQIDKISGTGVFTSNAINSSSNNMILGINSGATANIIILNPLNFNKSSNNQIVLESNSLATGFLNQVVTNTQIRLTSVSGKFTANQIIYDPSTNSYANSISLYTSNGNINSTLSYGLRFNQTTRLTLSTNSSISFVVGEIVNQAASNASGIVLDTTHELDLIYSPISGTISAGLILNNANTNANAIVTYANSTYIRLTAINGSFANGNIISTVTANGSITAVLPVLVVNDTFHQYPFSTGFNSIQGLSSGATGLLGIANTIVYPDLIRNTGDVMYVNDLPPFSLSPNSKEGFNVVLAM